jgi:hypothetical protein
LELLESAFLLPVGDEGAVSLASVLVVGGVSHIFYLN